MTHPTVFHDDTGRILGLLPAPSDLRKLRLELLNGGIEDKCLVLDIQTQRTVVMKAGDAIGLDPSQHLILKPVAFASLCNQRLVEIEQCQVHQGKLRRLKQALMRLAFWRAR